MATVKSSFVQCQHELILCQTKVIANTEPLKFPTGVQQTVGLRNGRNVCFWKIYLNKVFLPGYFSFTFDLCIPHYSPGMLIQLMFEPALNLSGFPVPCWQSLESSSGNCFLGAAHGFCLGIPYFYSLSINLACVYR